MRSQIDGTYNIETKILEKLTKYRQLAFEMRERRLGYEIRVVPVIIVIIIIIIIFIIIIIISLIAQHNVSW